MSPPEHHAPHDPAARKPSAAFTSPLADADLDAPGDAPRATLLDGLVTCPHCRGWIEPDADYSGKPVACPHCDGHLQMPETIALGFAPARDGGATATGPGPGRAGRPPGEPWFYGFINAYAKIWMWLSLLGFVLLLLGAAVFMLRVAFTLGGGHSWIVALLPAAILVAVVHSLLGILLTVAFLHLAVDIARNLRAIRHRDPDPRR